MADNWQVIGSRQVGEYVVFSVHEEIKVVPRTGEKKTFFTIGSPDWINIVPLTTQKTVLMVKQYRHGTKEYCYEFPAGAVEHADESPLETARREMIEEIGYDSKNIVSIGLVKPNPALFANTGFVYLAWDVYNVDGQNLEDTEDLEVLEFPLEDVFSMVATGKVTHALTICTIFFLSAYMKSLP